MGARNWDRLNTVPLVRRRPQWTLYHRIRRRSTWSPRRLRRGPISRTSTVCCQALGDGPGVTQVHSRRRSKRSSLPTPLVSTFTCPVQIKVGVRGDYRARALDSSTGATHAAHRNVTPTDNTLREGCICRRKRQFQEVLPFGLHTEQPFSGMVVLASRCFRLCHVSAPCDLPIPTELLSFSVPLRQQAHPLCFILHTRDAGSLTPLGTSFLVRSHKA